MSILTDSPSSALLSPVLVGRVSPTIIDYRKNGYPYSNLSNLEDLAQVTLSWWLGLVVWDLNPWFL